MKLCTKGKALCQPVQSLCVCWIWRTAAGGGATFSFIHKEEKALFYWDYDNLLLSPQSPALGLAPAFRNNLTRFPNRISADQFNNLTRIPHIDFVAATSQSAQSRYIPAWLKQQLTPEERRTAIVLADEGMLQSAVQSIPAHSAGGPQEINITKGYPLTSTPAYAAMMRWLQSQENTGDTKAGSTANTADTLAALQHFLRTVPWTAAAVMSPIRGRNSCSLNRISNASPLPADFIGWLKRDFFRPYSRHPQPFDTPSSQ